MITTQNILISILNIYENRELHKSQLLLMSKYSMVLNFKLGCYDYSRVDFRMDEKGNVYCLEINTLPGLTSKFTRKAYK